jgi:hypothetical protein
MNMDIETRAFLLAQRERTVLFGGEGADKVPKDPIVKGMVGAVKHGYFKIEEVDGSSGLLRLSPTDRYIDIEMIAEGQDPDRIVGEYFEYPMVRPMGSHDKPFMLADFEAAMVQCEAPGIRP